MELPDKDQQLAEGQMLILHKGTSRRIEAISDRLVYLNIHKRRRAMGLSGMDAFRHRT